MPLSQIHYYFGSRQELILAVLAAENDRLLARQAAMYAGTEPLWRQWEQACDFLEADLESGYVRVLQEMIAAGWSDPALAASVREQLGGWFRLLTDVARREERRVGDLGPFTPEEVGALMAPAVPRRRGRHPARVLRVGRADACRAAQDRRPAARASTCRAGDGSS